MHPKRCALADRHRLCRLVMRITRCWERFVLLREDSKVCDHLLQLAAQMTQRIPVQNQISVICHITARSPKVDDPRGGRSCLPIDINVRHYVVMDFSFPCSRKIKINICNMSVQFRNLLCRDGQAQLMLHARQLRPKTAPRFNPCPLGEQMEHIGGCIARG